MKIRVRLTQYDLIEGGQNVVCESNAVLQDNRLDYLEDKAGTIRHTVRFAENGILIRRSGEVESSVLLRRNQTGEARVKSAYGTMIFETKLHFFRQDEEVWEAEYSIMQGKDTVTHQRMVWELQGLTDE